MQRMHPGHHAQAHQPPAPAPKGWEMRWSLTYQGYYYHHLATHHTTWHTPAPDQDPGQADKAAREAPRKIVFPWVASQANIFKPRVT